VRLTRTPGTTRRATLVLEHLEDRLVPAGTQPSALDQLMLEQLNDARANPTAYGNSIGLDLSTVAPSQPLAWDTRLIAAAELHSQDMSANSYFGHNDLSGNDPGQRITAQGYTWTSWGESIAAGYSATADALSALIIDNGIPDLGHRRHLLAIDPVFQTQTQVGIGVLMNGTGPYTNYYTIDTAAPLDTRPFITGVVFNDLNHNGKYDIGEGLGNVTITVQGVGSVASFGSGGYQIQVNPGTYTVTASGGGLAATQVYTVTVGSQNQRLSVISGDPGNTFLMQQGTAAQVSQWGAQPIAGSSLDTVAGQSTADVTTRADVNVGVGQWAGLVARYTGTGDQNMYFGALTGIAGGYQATIWRNLGGTWTPLVTRSYTGAGQGSLRFNVFGATQELYLNDTLVAYAHDGILTGPGSSGLRTYGGVVMANFSTTALPPSSQPLPFADSFAGSSLNGTWTTQMGSFQVSAGHAGSLVNSRNLATVTGLSASDVSVQADVAPTNGQWAGLVTRYSGTGDQTMYLGVLVGTAGGFQAMLWRDIGGNWTQLTSQSYVGVGAGTFRFDVIGSSLRLYLNGNAVAWAADSQLIAGSVGLRSFSNVQYSNFQAGNISPSLPFSDTFSTTGSLSSSWLQRMGTFQVGGGLTKGTAGVGNLATLGGVTATDVSVQADVAPTSGQWAGLVARYSGAGDMNMYFGAIMATATGYQAMIWRNAGGAWTVLASQSFTGSSTGTLRFDVVGSMLRLYLNGNLLVSATDSVLTSGGVGMRTFADATMDNFVANAL
jgi:uncharacterized protein YkwD